jgi:hypothetical protein
MLGKNIRGKPLETGFGKRSPFHHLWKKKFEKGQVYLVGKGKDKQDNTHSQGNDAIQGYFPLVQSLWVCRYKTSPIPCRGVAL